VLQVAGLLGEQASAAAKQRAAAAAAAAGEEDDGDAWAAPFPAVLYASGEESIEQLAGRAERLKVDPEGVMAGLYGSNPVVTRRLQAPGFNRLQPSK
jgi:hypothetical protein